MPSSLAPLYFSVLGASMRQEQQRAALENAKLIQERQENREDQKAAASYITRMAEVQVEQEKLAARKASAEAENAAFLSAMLGDSEGMGKVYGTREQRAGHDLGMKKGMLKAKEAQSAAAQQAFENKMSMGDLLVDQGTLAERAEYHKGYLDLMRRRNATARARIRQGQDNSELWRARSAAQYLMGRAKAAGQNARRLFDPTLGVAPDSVEQYKALRKEEQHYWNLAHQIMPRMHGLEGWPGEPLPGDDDPELSVDLSTRIDLPGAPRPPEPAASDEQEADFFDRLMGLPGQAADAFNASPLDAAISDRVDKLYE